MKSVSSFRLDDSQEEKLEEEPLDNSEIIRLLIESGLSGRSSEDLLAETLEDLAEEYSSHREQILLDAAYVLRHEEERGQKPGLSQATL